MGLAEVQKALARLSIDPALRDRFFADPDATAAELSLAAADVPVLAQIPRGQVEQFADSLRRKRHQQVRRVIPITARALGRQFAALFDRYIDESPPRGSSADIGDAIGFVAAIARLADRLEPEWAIDLARYELAWREAAQAGRVPIVRLFRFPVARLATLPDRGPLAPSDRRLLVATDQAGRNPAHRFPLRSSSTASVERAPSRSLARHQRIREFELLARSLTTILRVQVAFDDDIDVRSLRLHRTIAVLTRMKWVVFALFDRANRSGR